MRRNQPSLSITLPRNFTFHYTDGQEPKTPEQEIPTPIPKSPQAYRIKRRARPTVLSSQSHGYLIGAHRSADIPIPTIETSAPNEQSRVSLPQQTAMPPEAYLAPTPSRPFMTHPRTPSCQRTLLGDIWNTESLGDIISRPMSSCSIMSDCSDESDDSERSPPSQGDSCTSPESDAPDPFRLSLVQKGKRRIGSVQISMTENPQSYYALKPPKIHWTLEMDRHLWAVYLTYLQDPTVTPFKTLPGSPPPLGVCHRVARKARRTWKSLKAAVPKPSGAGLRRVSNGSTQVRGESPDTIRADRSGSSTPTGTALNDSAAPRITRWPKSGSSTRRRLRELCKRKPTIAPHYQRLLQARGPSPFSSSSPHRPPRSSRVSSPFSSYHQQDPFSTRSIHLSLTTSTAATMQPNGPLAQLTNHENSRPSLNADWFNEPTVPWASPAAIPSSELGTGPVMEDVADLPRLGSPFGHYTWGPSRSRQHQQLRPTTPRIFSDISTQVPTLRSPVHLYDRFPYPSINKRRAQHQLEDELSPGGSDIRTNLLENLFGGQTEGRHRRVRSRGFSLGDVNPTERLTNLFTPPSADDRMRTPEPPEPSTTIPSSLAPPPRAETIRRLGSPFSGLGGRSPQRMRGASLQTYDSTSFASIDQTLGQGGYEDIMKRLRGE